MRILFITSNRIGDAILSSGILSYLIERHKDARITIACGPLAASLFAHAPGVEKVIKMRKASFARHWLRLLAQIMFRRWDMVVDLRGSATAWLLFAGKRYILKPDHTKHRVPHIASVLGLDAPPSPKLWPGEAARAKARALIPNGMTVLAIGPTANWPRKQWPAPCFVELVMRLTGPDGALAGAHIMLEGGPDEREICAPLLATIPRERLIDQIGSDLNTAYASFERVRLYIGNDSGLMHLAAAAGAPTLGLFGPTRDDLYAPWGPKAAFVRGPRSHAEIVSEPGFDMMSRTSAMQDLTVEKVLQAAEALLARTQETRATN